MLAEAHRHLAPGSGHARAGYPGAEADQAAYHLGQLIAAGVLDDATAERELLTAASVHFDSERPVAPGEARKVIRGGIAAGKRKPRPLPAPREAAA
jgi:hypothetical protein